MFSGRKISRTLIKIILYIAVTMLATVIVFSNILYRKFEQKQLRIINENNMKSLFQLSRNITYMNEAIINFCHTQYMDPDVNFILIAKDFATIDSLSAIKIVKKLQTAALSNAMIHSVIVYNGDRQEYHATSGWTVHEDDELIEILVKSKDIPLLHPIPRILTEDTYFKEAKKVFTYILYDLNGNETEVQNALVVNANTSWLFGKLEKLKGNSSNLFLIDKNGNILNDESEEQRFYKQIDETYINTIRRDNKAENSIIATVGNEKRVITYLVIPELDWILINDQPYDLIFEPISDIKNETIMVTSAFLIIVLIISVFISGRIYKPFNLLIKHVRYSFRDSIAASRDDAEYLANVFNASLNKLKDYEDYKITTRDVLKENLLKTMLMESTTGLNNAIEENFMGYSHLFTRSSIIRLILLKIDRYNTFVELDSEIRKSVRFVIANVSSEIMNNLCNNEVILMGNGECAVIVDENTIDSETKLMVLKENIMEIQKRIHSITDFSVSAFISSKAEDVDLLSKCYKELQVISKYRIIFGQGTILDMEMGLDESRGNDKIYPEKLEDKLLAAIKQNDSEGLRQEFEQFILYIYEMNIESFMLSLTRLALAINRTVNNMNINRLNEISVDFNSFYGTLMKLETIEDIRSEFYKIFEIITSYRKIDSQNKHTVIVHSVKEFIQKDYDSKELCLKKVADEFKLSPVYLGMIFKENTKISVQEFINETRMEKAVYLLENTENTVYEIIEKTGFDNKTNFHRLFRKYFGSTPKEYRLNINLQDKLKK